jgi:hypothetical protein
VTVTRLDGAETYYALSRTDGDGHLITIHNGAVSCTCPARNGTCWAAGELVDTLADPVRRLRAIGRELGLMVARERDAVVDARRDDISWHRIAVALGRTTEGVRRKYRETTG